MKHRAMAAHSVISVALVCALASPGTAQEPPPAADPYTPAPDAIAAPPGQTRGYAEPPDDGRIPVLSAVADGLGAAARFTLDVVFAPFRGALYLEDRHQVFTSTRDLFYNDDHTAGVLPSLSMITGFGTKVGATVFHKDVFGHRERVTLSGSYAGTDRHSAQLKLKLPELAGGHLYVSSRGRFEADDVLYFQGIGNRGGPAAAGLQPDAPTRYAEQRWFGEVHAGARLGSDAHRIKTGFTLMHNRRDFDATPDPAETPISDVYDITALPGFDERVSVTELTADFQLDTRDARGSTGNGALITAFGGKTVPGGDWEFWHYGAEATMYYSPWRPGRVFIARATHEGVRGDAIPFADLPRLGGAGLLRGYKTDRFRDELAAIGMLEYHWPIHNNISGALFVESGKVANSYDELAGDGLADHWHTGVGGGLIVHTLDNVVVNAQAAYGDDVQLYLTVDVLQAFRKRRREL